MTTLMKKLDTATALKLKLAGRSYATIGEMYGISGQAVHQRISHIFKNLAGRLEQDQVRAYEQHKDDVLTVSMGIIVDSMLNPDKIEKASLNNLAYAYSQLDHAQRLTRDQATENINVHSVVSETKDMLEQAKAALTVGQSSDNLPTSAPETVQNRDNDSEADQNV